jgi:hypothetical protein
MENAIFTYMVEILIKFCTISKFCFDFVSLCCEKSSKKKYLFGLCFFQSLMNLEYCTYGQSTTIAIKVDFCYSDGFSNLKKP